MNRGYDFCRQALWPVVQSCTTIVWRPMSGHMQVECCRCVCVCVRVRACVCVHCKKGLVVLSTEWLPWLQTNLWEIYVGIRANYRNIGKANCIRQPLRKLPRPFLTTRILTAEEGVTPPCIKEHAIATMILQILNICESAASISVIFFKCSCSDVLWRLLRG